MKTQERRKVMKVCLSVLAIVIMAFIAGMAAWLPQAIEAQSPSLIGYDDISVREDVAVIQVPLELSSAPTGLSGFTLDIEVSGSTISGIAVDSAFNLHHVDMQASHMLVSAADVMQNIGPGVGIPLAVIEIVPHGVGEISLVIDIIKLDDDDGSQISAGVDLGVIEVRPFPTLPGLSNKVRDLDGDGLAEDLNGNGRVDFVDLVELFANVNNLDLVRDVDLFDWNGNGRADFDDIVAMFDWMI